MAHGASWLWGRYSPAALTAVALTASVDQAHKWWMLWGYRREHPELSAMSWADLLTTADEQARLGERFSAGPFLDIVYKKNTGVSFSWLDGTSYGWQLGLAAFAVLVSAAMWAWIARAGTGRLMAVSLGLLIGGALGNAIDRVVLGGVNDYFMPHAFGMYWPAVFNIADVAIVAGVAGLLYDSVVPSRNDAAKPS
ncbi:MAG: signal peptidase II [Hyphomicrobiaceae bacterium]|nr:signal peptidase II [Hyphomicrobiaceae bacterium]